MITLTAPALRADAEIAVAALETYIRALCAVFTAGLANKRTLIAAVVVYANDSAVAAQVAVFAPENIFSRAFFAELFAALAHQRAIIARLTAFLADIGAPLAAVVVKADTNAVATDVAFAAPAHCL